MFSITFKRDNDQCECDVRIAVPGLDSDRVFYFKWCPNNETYAQMLVNEMSKQMRDQISELKRDFYEQGYRDAKQKRRKRTFFPTTWA